MADSKAKVKVAGGFPPGTVVKLYPRTGDFFAGQTAGDSVGQAKVNKQGEAVFSGLEEGATFWAVAFVDGTARERKVTAKRQPRTPGRQSEQEIQAALAQTRPPMDPSGKVSVVTGARGTGSTQLRKDREIAEALHDYTREHDSIDGMATPTKGGPPQEPNPKVKAADVPDNVQQRSATPLGEGHPVHPDELQPKVPQSEVPKGTPQRSDTELGEATPVERGEVQPKVDQRDAPKGLRQRSATPFGGVEPVSTGDPRRPPPGNPIQQAKRQDDSGGAEREPRKVKKVRASKGKRRGATKPRKVRPARVTGPKRARPAKEAEAKAIARDRQAEVDRQRDLQKDLARSDRDKPKGDK